MPHRKRRRSRQTRVPASLNPTPPRSARTLPERSAGRSQQTREIILYGADANIVNFPCRALNDLHSTFGNLLAHRDTKGYAHEVSILELHPWPFVPVVQ